VAATSHVKDWNELNELRAINEVLAPEQLSSKS
jgi:hypothetical protein